MRPFSLDIDLPPGATLVEASAGTGKTWSIARLIARLLVEDGADGGAPPTIGQILVVTFTEAATAELRDRLRALLVQAVREVERVRDAVDAAHMPIPAPPPQSGLEVLVGVRAGDAWSPLPPVELARRALRLRQAIQDFDTAAVRTIHGFCQQLVQRLSFEADAPFDSELLEHQDDLLGELVDDWMARRLTQEDLRRYRWLVSADGAALTRTRLLAVAKAAVANRHAAFLPPPGDLQVCSPVHLQHAREVWERFAGDEGRALLAKVKTWVATKQLHNGKYKLASMDDHFAQTMRWLEDGALGPAPTRHFTQDHILQARSAAAARRDAAVFCDPLLMAVQQAAHLPDTDAHVVDFAAWCVAAWDARLAEQHAITFDDMLLRVRAGLANPTFCTAVRALYQVALIDEFQDTDAVQWDIFRTLFLDSPQHRLVLIGDPKQAIYAFRGADIAVYGAARQHVQRQGPQRLFSMDRNFRSDASLVAALNRMLLPAPRIFETDIDYTEVTHVQPDRLHDAAGQSVTPVVVHWLHPAATGHAPDKRTTMGKASARIIQAAAADIARSLASGWLRSVDGGARRPVQPRDFAVLVATNRRAAAVRKSLLALGIPATLSQAGSVFASDEARWLQGWLDMLAMERDAAAARAFAATPLGGWSGAALVALRNQEGGESDRQWLALLAAASAQRQALVRHGVAVALTTMLHGPSGDGQTSPLQRLAQRPTAERTLTNLRHLGELLAGAALAGHLQVQGLARWLRDQRQQAHASAQSAELRLESDADTVTIMTLHKSKGLQFPIVYLLDFADGRAMAGADLDKRPLRFHDGEAQGQQVFLPGLGRAAPRHARFAWREALQERQRLLYVAMTRAEHRLVMYAAPTQDRRQHDALPPSVFEVSPLGLLTLGSGPHASRLHNAYGGWAHDAPAQESDTSDAVAATAPVQPLRDAQALRSAVGEFVAAVNAGAAQRLCSIVDVETEADPPVHYRATAGVPLAVPCAVPASYDADPRWRRESYSGLIHAQASRLSAVAAAGGDGRAATPAPPAWRDTWATMASETDAATAVDEVPGQDELPSGGDAATTATHDEEGAEAVAMTSRAAPLRDGLHPATAALADDPADAATGDPLDDTPVAWADLPRGVAAGLWVHEVLEKLSFTDTPPRPKDRQVALGTLVRRHGLRHGFTDDRYDAMVQDHLTAILTTPLGGATAGASLRQVGDAARLDELKFDLLVGQVGAPRVDATVRGRQLAQTLGTPRADTALPATYFKQVRQMQFPDLRGFLTGTIDMVFHHKVEGQDRWFVVDYKTNTLGPSRPQHAEPSCLRHYTRPWMAAEIARHHYYIQYLLYLTALHRYLRLRLRNYSYDRHIGGVLYLFVRGMAGEQTRSDGTQVNGVYFDRPPADLIDTLSEVLSGSEVAP